MRTRFIGFIAAALAAILMTSGPAAALQKPVSSGSMITKTFTIEAIDKTSRIVTLKDPAGMLESVYCGPEVQRFDSLKVGDMVTFRYNESVVTALRRPGQAPRPTESAGVTRTPGANPGGVIAQQTTSTVTLQAIDAKTPSVTVKTDRGQVMSIRIQDAKNLEGYKVGDTVEITYTQALAVSVEPAKK
jgi:Cu/Ag efflux protein CusF